jgi:enterochelin esterase-like enzyme
LTIFEIMETLGTGMIVKQTLQIPAARLERTITVDLYLPPSSSNPPLRLLLLNDGQDLEKMEFLDMLEEFCCSDPGHQVLCIGIHAGPDRKLEYGTAHAPDYKGRGNLARGYTHFILEELFPCIRALFPGIQFAGTYFGGFSLGGLSALDIVWNHPGLFDGVGVFSGSLWWRSLDKDDPAYLDDQHRIIHHLIQQSSYRPGLRFFFECGTLDETADRNRNGVIDSIDDTLDLIRELVRKGYDPTTDICYLEIDGGRHDVATWGLAMPEFLKWISRK